MNPRSRQSSIHHLAAELATCQPAAPCESRTRHVQIPSVPCERAPAAPAAASCASANMRPASDAAVAPVAARSTPPGCNRVRAAGPDAAAPAPRTSARNASPSRATISASRVRKPIAQPRHFFIFQQQDRVVQRVVVHAIAARAIESIVAVAAQPAQRFRGFGTRSRRRAPVATAEWSRADSAPVAVAATTRKRPPATLAHRFLYRLERRQAWPRKSECGSRSAA